MISNITRNTELEIPAEQRRQIRWRKMSRIASGRMAGIRFRVFPRLDNQRGMSDNRRQWADFLVVPNVPPHRQYKTARTETRRHLLLKIWQMTTQTSASRGYVLFDIKMAFMPSVVWCRKGHTQKSYKLSAGMRTYSVECSKLGKTRIIDDAQTSDQLEMSHFVIRISTACSSETPTV